MEVAGQLTLSARGQRELGHVARTCFPTHRFGYAAPDVPLRSASRLGRRVDGLWKLPRLAAAHDVFHFHFAQSFLPGLLGHADARMLRRMGRTVAVEFWGDDVRVPSLESARNPYFKNPYGADERTSRARLARWAGITGGHAIMADHSFDVFLEPYFPHVHVVGQRMDLSRLAPLPPRPDAAVPVLVHAPSHLAAKGTKFVRAAVERLRARRLPFEYVELNGVSHDEALAQYRRADLVVDQVCTGYHGVLAVEGMALAKPVVCYTLPELEATYPAGYPLINANPDTVTAVLEEWLQRPAERHAAGLASREYAERVHDHRAVAARLLDAYDRIARDEAPAAACT